MKTTKLVLILFIILGLIAVFSYRYISPILHPFPKLSGSYAIGTTLIELKDSSRKETYSNNPNDVRSLMIRIWFPAQATNTKTKPFYALSDEIPYIAPQLALQNNIPEWLAKIMLRGIKTHASVDAPLSIEQPTFPVILFSHGLLGPARDFYTSIIEEIVSHGYIIIAIDHAYLSWATVYPDGRAVTSAELGEKFERMAAKDQYAFQNEAMKVYIDDIRFVLDQLSLINNNPQTIFYNRLDLNHIGIMGHSGGGTAAIETCRVDKRCKAAVDLDGWFDQAIEWEPLNVPLLLMFAGKEPTDIEEPTARYLQRKGLTREQYIEREKRIINHKKMLCSSPLCEMLYLPHADHGSFSDWPLAKWPLRAWNTPNPNGIIKEINDHILSFFERHLKSA